MLNFKQSMAIKKNCCLSCSNTLFGKTVVFNTSKNVEEYNISYSLASLYAGCGVVFTVNLPRKSDKRSPQCFRVKATVRRQSAVKPGIRESESPFQSKCKRGTNMSAVFPLTI